MRLRDAIGRGEADYPQRTALIFRDAATTYGELAAQVERLAAIFAACGIEKGEPFGLLLPNCPLFVAAYYAGARLGAVVVPVNPLLKPAELAYIWRDSDVRLVVTVPPLLPAVTAARQSLPSLKTVLALDPAQDLSTVTPADFVVPDGDTLPKIALTAAPCPPLDENDCAVIIYTSGTTGHPKGAMLSCRNLVRNAEQCQARLDLLPNDRMLTVLPLFHSFAATVCMNLTLHAGAAAVLHESFVPVRVFEAIERHKVTIFPAVPAIFHALLQTVPEPPPDFSTVRMFVSGGAALPLAVLAALEPRFGVPVLEGYGPTECSPVVAVNPLEGIRKPGTVGLPLPGVAAAIFDEANCAVPTGAVGEVVVRGDNVMLGYLNQPDATAEAMAGGWYHTGDMGTLDADGYLAIVDRKKDMIIAAGLNVYPREVEEVLALHPAVAESAVVGLPDARRGEEVAAVVIRKPDESPTERELIAHCRERLANYKVPRKIIFAETLPRSGTGKVLKRVLRDELQRGD